MAPNSNTKMTEQQHRPRKKLRFGGVASPAATTSDTRTKFAFGSRLPVADKSLVKSSGRDRRERLRNARAQANSRNRRRSVLEEAPARTKPSRRSLAVKTTLPLQDSHLPAPTKVLSGKHVHTISPSNPASRSKNQKRKEAEPEVDLAATEPAFWIKRREAVEAALKELDTIEKRIASITK